MGGKYRKMSTFIMKEVNQCVHKRPAVAEDGWAEQVCPPRWNIQIWENNAEWSCDRILRLFNLNVDKSTTDQNSLHGKQCW